MVCEIKLFSTNFLPKNIDGGPIGPWIEEVRNLSSNAPLVVNMSSARVASNSALSGIVADYKRLATKVDSGNVLKLLMLVLNTKPTANQFGEVIQQIDFEQPAAIVHKRDDIICKLWRIQGEH